MTSPIETEDVVRQAIEPILREHDTAVCRGTGHINLLEQLPAAVAAALATPIERLREENARREAAAERLFKSLEHLRDTSGTETRLERGNRAAYHSALEIARAALTPSADDDK